MRRKADELLREWRDRADRKPLLVKGVRQCGKTYLLRTYAQDLFESVVYVNLENDRSARADFSGGLDPHSIVRAIEARTGQRIVPGKTLLFIDEIQACEEALTSLKYFCEDAPEYYVAAAGSLLGVAINHQSYSFPVGKTDLIEMTPLDFEEFLWAMGHDQLVDEIRSSFELMGPLAPSLHEKALRLYRQYLVVGGMPEAVQTYIDDQSIIDVAEKHRIILDGYSADTNKYADERLSAKTRACFDSIPQQLAKENRKFQYKVVRAGGNASLFGDALDWLVLSGTVARCSLVGQIESPLEAFVNPSAFKIYQADTGLLVSKAGAQRADILAGIGGTFMGALTENYVAQSLKANGHRLFFYSQSGKKEGEERMEIDFLVTRPYVNAAGKPRISPIEVKSPRRYGTISLDRFRARFNKKIGMAYVLHPKQLEWDAEAQLAHLPLYMAFCL